MKEVNALNCGRENELIAFLYGELNDVEAQIFQRHIRDCASCGVELGALRDVHESVVTWRNETLGVITSPIADSPLARVEHQRPSALAALREFFNLAPLWMKGALAFASVLFCLFAGLAVARLQEEPQVVIAENPRNAYSQQEFDAQVQRRVHEELQRIQDTGEKTPTTRDVISADRTPRQRVAKRGSSLASNTRRPLSKTESEQLAADLRLISARNDNELDLLDDGINQ